MPEGGAFAYIGTIRSPHTTVVGMPIQPTGAAGLVGRVDMRPDLVGGLKDLEGFSHIILIYHLHRAEGYSLEVVPFLDDASHGIFATRSPRRPNAIGISVVRLLSVQGSGFRFANPDMLDGTPLLDVKPYVAAFDRAEPEREGWFAGRAALSASIRSDDRFSGP
jgi:tRNA-Thr(GGU) m(6)t(6)A37 methyltransferase TsaA